MHLSHPIIHPAFSPHPVNSPYLFTTALTFTPPNYLFSAFISPNASTERIVDTRDQVPHLRRKPEFSLEQLKAYCLDASMWSSLSLFGKAIQYYVPY